MISIIIPTYNQHQYLADAIDSALNQTVWCEIIVVNDGSTDKTDEVMKSYIEMKNVGEKHDCSCLQSFIGDKTEIYLCENCLRPVDSPRIKYIKQVNKGLASARNTAIMNATGDYILPLDSDDILMDDCAEKIMKTIQATNADIVAPSFKCFGLYNHEVILSHPLSVDLFKEANCIGYFSAIRKSALLEVGGYNPKMTWGWEDYDLWVDLLKRGKTVITIPEPLVLYRTKEVSMITEANKHADELLNQMRINHPEVYA